jgi:hypothetical protein
MSDDPLQSIAESTKALAHSMKTVADAFAFMKRVMVLLLINDVVFACVIGYLVYRVVLDPTS